MSEKILVVIVRFLLLQLKTKCKIQWLNVIGVQHNMQVDSIKNKSRATAKRKQFKKFVKYLNFVKPLFTEDEYVNENELKWKCVKCRKYI